MKAVKLLFLLTILFSGSVYSQSHDWVRTNPGGGGAFSNVKAGPSGVIIAGSDLSGAYRSMDMGLSWNPIGATQGVTKTHISGMGFDPYDAAIIYLGTTQGIFRSQDTGNVFSWVLDNGYVNDIVAAKSNASVVYASYHSAWNTTIASIYKSTNQGLDWFKVSDDFPELRILKIDISSTDENNLYFLAGKGRGACGLAELYRSSDGGETWVEIGASLGTILDFEVHPSDPSIIYATTMNADCSAQYYYTDRLGNLFRSPDSGDTWEEKSDRTGIIWLDPDSVEIVRLIDPRNTEDWNTKSGTWTSQDSGSTWTKTGDNITWTTGFQHSAYGTPFDGICKSLGEDMSNPDNMYWVDSQWVYGSFDKGVYFEHLNTTEVFPNWWQSRGFDNVNMMDFEINKANPHILYAAYFDIGLWRSLNHGITWQSCNQEGFTGSWGEDGGNTISIVSDPELSHVIWATMSKHQKGQSPTYLVKSDQTGIRGSWILSNYGLPDVEVMGLSLDPNSPAGTRILFVTAEGNVYRSVDDGMNWEKVLDEAGLRFTSVSNFNSNVIFAGGGGGLWKSVNGGDTWFETGLIEMRGTEAFWGWGNGKGVFDIACSPHNPGVVYVTVFGEGKGLYKSSYEGFTWTKLFTDDYMRKVAVSPLDSSIIYATSSRALTSGGYVGESKGVLFSKDGGETFIESNEGMTWPFAHTVNVDALNWVFIGSPGTGFQKSPVPDVAIECLTDGVIFASQDQIDNFRNIYPYCSEILGDVSINGPDISSLNGLLDIEYIWGDLIIKENEILSDLSGLDSLIFVGEDLVICENSSLTNLTGIDRLNSISGSLLLYKNDVLDNVSSLHNVDSLEGSVFIELNNSLPDLLGLENLQSIGGYLEIRQNSILTTLEGLNSITSIGSFLSISMNENLIDLSALSTLITIGGDSFSIYSNDALTSLSGLDNIEAQSIQYLYFVDNPLLSECDIQCVCNYLIEQGGEAEIFNNAPGCNSEEEVIAACTVSAPEISSDDDLTIFIIPISQTLYINSAKLTVFCDVKIYNQTGQKIIHERFIEDRIDISGLRPGMYVIELVSNDMIFIRKFLVK